MLHSFFGYKIRLQFNKCVLFVEENNHATKIVTIQIVYDLDDWINITLNNFELKMWLFGATNIAKNNENSVLYVVAIEQHLMEQVGEVLIMTFFFWNITIFDVDNSSSSDADNRKNKFLVLGE